MKYPVLQLSVRPAITPSIILLVVVVFSTLQTYAQSPTSLSFEYNSPRNGKPVSASNFLAEFKIKNTYPGCYFAMSTCRFRVSKTGVVNRITWEGELLDGFKVAMEQQIMESQPYWKCEGCEKANGFWVTVPIYVSYALTQTCSSVNNPFFYQSRSLMNSLFKENEKGLLRLSDSEWLLAPVYATSIR